LTFYAGLIEVFVIFVNFTIAVVIELICALLKDGGTGFGITDYLLACTDANAFATADANAHLTSTTYVYIALIDGAIAVVVNGIAKLICGTSCPGVTHNRRWAR
jgi:hypothetical protein